MSLWPSFFSDRPPLSAGLAGHSSHLGNSFWSFGLVKTMSVVKMACERVKSSSRISSNLPTVHGLFHPFFHFSEKRFLVPSEITPQLSTLSYPLKLLPNTSEISFFRQAHFLTIVTTNPQINTTMCLMVSTCWGIWEGGYL